MALQQQPCLTAAQDALALLRADWCEHAEAVFRLVRHDSNATAVFGKLNDFGEKLRTVQDTLKSGIDASNLGYTQLRINERLALDAEVERSREVEEAGEQLVAEDVYCVQPDEMITDMTTPPAVRATICKLLDAFAELQIEGDRLPTFTRLAVDFCFRIIPQRALPVVDMTDDARETLSKEIAALFLQRHAVEIWPDTPAAHLLDQKFIGSRDSVVDGTTRNSISKLGYGNDLPKHGAIAELAMSGLGRRMAAYFKILLQLPASKPPEAITAHVLYGCDPGCTQPAGAHGSPSEASDDDGVEETERRIAELRAQKAGLLLSSVNDTIEKLEGRSAK